MSCHRVVGWLALALAVAIGLDASVALGQIDESWYVFLDSESDSECGVINTANAELVLLESDQLAVVSGLDTVLEDSFVNEDDEVFIDGEPAGYLEFLTDGDGYRSMFWTTLTGNMVEVDAFTGQPSDSGLLPGDRINAGCDACAFIENHADCPESVALVPFCGAGTTGALSAAFLFAPLLVRRPGRR